VSRPDGKNNAKEVNHSFETRHEKSGSSIIICNPGNASSTTIPASTPTFRTNPYARGNKCKAIQEKCAPSIATTSIDQHQGSNASASSDINDSRNNHSTLVAHSAIGPRGQGRSSRFITNPLISQSSIHPRKNDESHNSHKCFSSQGRIEISNKTTRPHYRNRQFGCSLAVSTVSSSFSGTAMRTIGNLETDCSDNGETKILSTIGASNIEPKITRESSTTAQSFKTSVEDYVSSKNKLDVGENKLEDDEDDSILSLQVFRAR
jgi:hypothetical protein